MSGLDPEMLSPGGGGGTESQSRVAKAASGESMRGEYPLLIREVRGTSPEIFFKIYVSENAFQAILKPIFYIL